MQPVSPGATNYDTRTIVFHWATAILIVVQWIGAQTIDLFPTRALRGDARSMHIVIGALLALIVLARLAWRATGGRRLPPSDTGLLELLSKATHWGLYLLVAAMLAVGLFLTWTRGDTVFGLFTIPAYDPGNKALAHLVQEIHGLLGYLILALAGLHAAAALMHRYLWHDGVLARMLTR